MMTGQRRSDGEGTEAVMEKDIEVTRVGDTDTEAGVMSVTETDITETGATETGMRGDTVVIEMAGGLGVGRETRSGDIGVEREVPGA